MKFELTISPDYVPDWGGWEAARELLQNAADADDMGFPMSITRTKGGTIKIYNKGADLDRSTLLLGATTKAGRGDQRGQFGEGYKLALIVFARMGIEVTCHTQTETWVPDLMFSEKFGAQILTIESRKVAKPRDGLTFLIKGLSDEDWETIQERCLFLKPPKEEEVVKTWKGWVLKEEKYRGQLYSRGLYVGPLPDSHYTTGFDLFNVELDRDRKLASPYSIRWEISGVLDVAVEGKTALALLMEDQGEAQAIESRYEYSASGSPFLEKIADAFLEEHGDDAIAVASMAEAMEAEHLGLKGVVVPKRAASILGKRLGDFQAKKKNRQLAPAKLFQLHELDTDEVVNFRWASDLLGERLNKADIQIVDFFGENINGTWQSQDGTTVIRLARKRLANRRDLISTLVHEVAHDFGIDGEHSHVQAIQRIFAEIIADRI